MFNIKRVKRLEEENEHLRKLLQDNGRELDMLKNAYRDTKKRQAAHSENLQQLIDDERAKHKRPTEYLRGLTTAMKLFKEVTNYGK